MSAGFTRARLFVAVVAAASLACSGDEGDSSPISPDSKEKDASSLSNDDGQAPEASPLPLDDASADTTSGNGGAAQDGGGSWGGAGGQPGCTPSPEKCNNLDDDCDGITDRFDVSCSTPCGTGTKTCVAGKWGKCSALQPITCMDYSTCKRRSVCSTSCPPAPSETCNNRDDNCDGTVDRISKSCSTACGTGKSTCVGGKWGKCSAPDPISCVDYSTCRRHSICASKCPSPPRESCNLRDDDCDGKCDESANCRIGVHRAYHPFKHEHFYTTNIGDISAGGYRLERANFFYVYRRHVAGTVPLYRCLLRNGYHFLTASAACEGASGAINQGALGYVATGSVCGSVPLYRILGGNDHFYTYSVGEKNNAIAGGWKYEGIAGYVWTSP